MTRISIGKDCNPAIWIAKVCGPRAFMPFDHAGTYDLGALLELIERRMEGFNRAVHPDHNVETLPDGHVPTIAPGNVIFRHHPFSASADPMERAAAVAKLERRTRRFLDAMSSGPVLLVRNTLPEWMDRERGLLESRIDWIRAIYGHHHDFLLTCIATDQDQPEEWDTALK